MTGITRLCLDRRMTLSELARSMDGTEPVPADKISRISQNEMRLYGGTTLEDHLDASREFLSKCAGAGVDDRIRKGMRLTLGKLESSGAKSEMSDHAMLAVCQEMAADKIGKSDIAEHGYALCARSISNAAYSYRGQFAHRGLISSVNFMETGEKSMRETARGLEGIGMKISEDDPIHMTPVAADGITESDDTRYILRGRLAINHVFAKGGLLGSKDPERLQTALALRSRIKRGTNDFPLMDDPEKGENAYANLILNIAMGCEFCARSSEMTRIDPKSRKNLLAAAEDGVRRSRALVENEDRERFMMNQFLKDARDGLGRGRNISADRDGIDLN